MVAAAGLQDSILVDSAGTSAGHAGEAPDQRAIAAAHSRGYDLSTLRSRPVSVADFSAFDYILAMDQRNLEYLRQLAPEDYNGQLRLLLDFHAHPLLTEIPDPYMGAKSGFDQVLDLIEAASEGLLRDIAG